MTNHNLKRILFSVLLTFAVLPVVFARGQTSVSNDIPAGSGGEFTLTGPQPELAIPPLLPYQMIDGEKVFRFDARESEHTFAPGLTSKTYGYSSTYLGPTIRVKKGDRVRFNVTNNLDEGTTVHWHGAHVPAEMDGNMYQPVAPGETWSAHYEIKQPAATLWYHPHYYHTTAQHAYFGMAGYYIIDDDETPALPLPQTYGEDDIPVVIQDRIFDRSGQLIYPLDRHTEMHGMLGDVVIVNGTVYPEYTVTNRLVRFRILNGSNSSVYNFRFSNGLPMAVIAGDAGLLEAPVSRTQLTLSPGERFEVVVDFTDLSAGDTFNLELQTHYGLETNAMSFQIDSLNDRGTSVPPQLAAVDRIDPADADNTRRFVMETMSRGGRLTINGKNMNMDHIDERIPLDSTEIWEIITPPGRGMMGNIPHNFHVHDVSFQILTINGNPPPPEYTGWKDTVFVPPGTTVRIIARFEDYTGLYMYHCHLLEHENYGMMGQFEVY